MYATIKKNKTTNDIELSDIEMILADEFFNSIAGLFTDDSCKYSLWISLLSVLILIQ